MDSPDFSVGGGETAGERLKEFVGPPLSPAFGASAPNPKPTGFPMLPAGLPKPNTLGFCGEAPNTLMGCSDEKAPAVGELLGFPEKLPPKRLVANVLGGSLLASTLSPVSVMSHPVDGVHSGGLPPSTLLPKIEVEVPNVVVVLAPISDVVLGTLDVAKNLGASGLDLKAENGDISDGFVDESKGFCLELREPVVPKAKKDGFDVFESSALEVPKVKADLGGSEADDEG